MLKITPKMLRHVISYSYTWNAHISPSKILITPQNCYPRINTAPTFSSCMYYIIINFVTVDGVAQKVVGRYIDECIRAGLNDQVNDFFKLY